MMSLLNSSLLRYEVPRLYLSQYAFDRVMRRVYGLHDCTPDINSKYIRQEQVVGKVL